jgi:hypothetical protein
MKQIDIVGAGMAGLLAANMLGQRSEVAVYEKQPSLPNNHSAVLRFRSSTIGDVLGIPFKKVNVVKTVIPWRNPVADALAYSAKNTGVMRSDRSIIDGEGVVERFIAPPDLIKRMEGSLDISYGREYGWMKQGNPVISTAPMLTLMAILNYPYRSTINFNTRPGWNIKATVPGLDAYASIAVPSPAHLFSRISVTGNEVIVEVPGWDRDLEHDHIGDMMLQSALELLGVDNPLQVEAKFLRQPYAKILPIDEGARREFIYWASHEHQVFSLGRYATWRPKLLLDDLVKDVRLIEGWINRADNYAMARAR